MNGRTVSLNPLDSAVCSSKIKRSPRTETFARLIYIATSINLLAIKMRNREIPCIDLSSTERCTTTSDSRVKRNCIHRTDCITIGAERWSCSKRLAVISRDTRGISAGANSSRNKCTTENVDFLQRGSTNAVGFLPNKGECTSRSRLRKRSLRRNVFSL